MVQKIIADKLDSQIRLNALEEAAHLCDLMAGEFMHDGTPYHRCAIAIRELKEPKLVRDFQALRDAIELLPASEKATMLGSQASRFKEDLKAFFQEQLS